MTQQQALDILKTGRNVFLTGSPGSGKTHTINEYVSYLRSCGVEPAITASTGIAATHIGGLTLHSWSGIGIKKTINKYELAKIAKTDYVKKRIKRASVLIIDEVSMLSPETFSMVDLVCREIKDQEKLFGGLQIVAVGDFFQLPPVVKSDASAQEPQMTLLQNSQGRFAYDSGAWEKAKFTICYLTEQHRQDDQDFLALLSALRKNEFSQGHLAQINARKINHQESPETAPKLFSHNVDVDRVNSEILDKLQGQPKIFSMHAQGPEPLVKFLKKSCLSPEALCLKIGAQVMFTKNNTKEGFVNGTLGTVSHFTEYTNTPVVKIRNGKNITVEPMDWTIEEYGKSRAKITQLPLRLAWAITVHKSQGMSLDEAVMDLSHVFEYGQGYVALSRVRRFSGLHILGFNDYAFKVDPEVLQKDGEFQKQSAKAMQGLSNVAPADIKKMSEQFILACGGTVAIASPKKPFVDFTKTRENHPNAYLPWDAAQDVELQDLFAKNMPTAELAIAFNRTKGAIRARLKKLGLLES